MAQKSGKKKKARLGLTIRLASGIADRGPVGLIWLLGSAPRAHNPLHVTKGSYLSLLSSLFQSPRRRLESLCCKEAQIVSTLCDMNCLCSERHCPSASDTMFEIPFSRILPPFPF